MSTQWELNGNLNQLATQFTPKKGIKAERMLKRFNNVITSRPISLRLLYLFQPQSDIIQENL